MSGLPEQVPKPGHCRVGTSAACCHQRGRLLALPLKQQLPRHCPGAPRGSRLCMLSPLRSAGAQAAAASPKPVFLRAIRTLLVGQPCYRACEPVIWGQAQEQRRTWGGEAPNTLLALVRLWDFALTGKTASEKTSIFMVYMVCLCAFSSSEAFPSPGSCRGIFISPSSTCCSLPSSLAYPGGLYLHPSMGPSLASGC